MVRPRKTTTPERTTIGQSPFWIKVPTLVTHGTVDPMFPVGHGEADSKTGSFRCRQAVPPRLLLRADGRRRDRGTGARAFGVLPDSAPKTTSDWGL